MTAEDDSEDDDGESITIGFGALPAGVTAVGTTTTTVSLIDDDVPAVTVQFGAAAYTATEGGAAVTVELTLSADPERDVTVPLTVTPVGTATTDDYTLSEMSVTFDAGEMSATLTVTAEDDIEDDDGESIMIGFGVLPARGDRGGYHNHHGEPGRQRRPGCDSAVRRGVVHRDRGRRGGDRGGHAIGGIPSATVTVPLTVTPMGTAMADDYTLSEMSVTINAGEMSATFTVTADEDMVDDDDESITIGFGPLPSGVTASSPETTTVSLADNDDPAVTVQFGAASYTATEGGTAATVAVTLSADPERTVTIPLLVTAGGTATTGDYTLSVMSVTINAGDTSATLTVTAEDDSEDDDGESITIGFGTLPAGVTAGTRDTTTVSLVDDDGPAVTAVTVRFGAATYTATEGDAVTIEVTLSADPERTVEVGLEVTTTVGASPTDYTLSATSLTFTSGQTTATFTVTADEDTDNDDGESITIGFVGLPSGVTALGTTTTIVSLADNDDPAVTVQFGAAAYTATEGGAAVTVELTLSAAPERTVTVPLEVTTGGGASSTDYTLSEMSVTFIAGQMSATFTVLAVEDMVDDDDESITIGFGTLPARGDRGGYHNHHGEPGR